MQRPSDSTKPRPWLAWSILVCSAVAWPQAGQVAAQIPFDRKPIQYSTASVHDPIATLQQRIDQGEVKLEFDERHGYLQSVLDALKVSTSSQMLVFSKTSFQRRLISPRSPRALYFNDEVYVGWVPQGDVLEVSSVDPEQGAIFYTLDQEQVQRPRFVRDQGNCLTCHASSRTQGVPGHVVRSVYASRSGLPHFGSGTFRTNHASPLKQRWGGWYVTGTHGKQRHMGNVISAERSQPENLDVESGANIVDLGTRTSIENYLTRHSDIVALMVLEHQTDMQNRITYASFESRLAFHDDQVMNDALNRPDESISESTRRRVNGASEKLLEYMLFVDETQLTDAIAGTTDFARQFAALGPRDSGGRSLREFDLERRVFKYPCSYLIYSEAFRALPAPVKDRVYRRLWEVLNGEDKSASFAHLSPSDRRAILEILLDTNSDLPAYWQPIN